MIACLQGSKDILKHRIPLFSYDNYLNDQGNVKTLQEFKTRIEIVNDLNLFQPIIDGVVHLCCCLLPKISKSFFYKGAKPNEKDA